MLIAGAIIATQGYPGPGAVDASSWCRSRGRRPVAVAVGLAVLLLVSVTPWAWLLITPLLGALALLYRQFGAVTREGHSVERVYDFARRVEQVSPDEAGTQQIVEAVRELLNAERVALWLPPYLDEEPRLVVSAENGAVWYDGPGDPDDVFRRRAVSSDGPLLVSFAKADGEEVAALARRGVSDLLGAPVMTAAGEPGYLEVCDRRSDIVSFADSDRAALDSMLTHVNAAIRHQQLLTQIRYDADHDRLTGLPNRQRLAAEIEQLLVRRTRPRRAGRPDPGLARQLHRGDRHARARRQRRAAARHRRAAPRARATAGAAGPDGGRAVRRPAARPVPGRHRARRAPAAGGRLHPRPRGRPGPRGDADHRRRRGAGARDGRRER